jgi:hypothetical protein
MIDLQTALLDLLKKVHDSDVRLIAGGGFGIYLKTNYVGKSGMRTFLDQWPEPRSTNDLDLFLRPELLIESLDLYTILATATEEEWEYALQLRDQYKKDPFIIEAGHLVYEYFSRPERLDKIRLRESPYFRPELQIDKFMSALQELFPVGAESSHGLAE